MLSRGLGVACGAKVLRRTIEHAIHPECPGSDSSDRSVAADLLLRQEPDEEEEDEGDGKEDDEDDEYEDDDGYSE